MFKKIIKALRTKDLRNKILFTAALLVLYRVVAHVPLPGVDPSQLAQFVRSNQFFGLLDVFSGGGLSSLSIVMLGVGPYITSSIVLQLLTQIIPKLHELQKEGGEEGQRKINQYTRWLAVPLGAVQAWGTIILFTRGAGQLGANVHVFQNLSPLLIAEIIAVAIAGSIFMMWLGELITEYGIGNGISLIIFAGIVARLPSQAQQTQATFDQSSLGPILGIVAVAIVVIAVVVLITEAQRNIPIRYARQIRGIKLLGGTTTHLPLRVNQAGVIPIIFALSILLFPGLIANFAASAHNQTIAAIAQHVVNFFNDPTAYAASYFVLVILFTYFYTSIAFEPKAIAENIQKSGGFVPGIRPGEPTARYLGKVSNRIVPIGALFLGAIAVMPFILRNTLHVTTLSVGGTSLLIVVSVVLETLQKLDAQLVEQEYTARVRRAF